MSVFFLFSVLLENSKGGMNRLKIWLITDVPPYFLYCKQTYFQWEVHSQSFLYLYKTETKLQFST